MLLFVASAFGEPPRDPDAYFFDQTLGDFREELEIARQEGKAGIFIFFEMDECPFCQRMRRTILNRPDVQAFYRKHFKNFAVDIEGDVEITDFQGKTWTMKAWAFRVHRVRATPVLAFFDLEGRRVVRYVGAPTDAGEFLLLGRYVVERAYLKMPFNRYKRLKRHG